MHQETSTKRHLFHLLKVQPAPAKKSYWTDEITNLIHVHAKSWMAEQI